jgi:hypothetical protein
MLFDTERVTREDLVLFINACFACTGQNEFYGTELEQEVSINFLHEYILGNYRKLYTRTLVAGINHFNQSLIIVNLLSSGKNVLQENRKEENELITKTLENLPPQRVFRIFKTLRQQKVNNRRTRAIMRDYLAKRPDPVFDAVKYRSSIRVAASHSHLKLPKEVGDFIFEGYKKKTTFTTPLLETFRQAHYSKEAVYNLPFTIAEGLAAKHKIPQDEFLKKIQPMMTANEKLRMQTTAAEAEVELKLDLSRAPLTKLAIYILSLSLREKLARRDELEQALKDSALRALRRAPMKLGRVAAVLDRSYSSFGSEAKRRRPLAIALAANYLLMAAAKEYKAFWTIETKDDLLVSAKGQTDLANPLLDALDWKAELIVIVSDGFENDPAQIVDQAAKLFHKHLDPKHEVSILHMNPVFDSENYSLKALGKHIPTLGLRDAEDLLTMIGFARFADGTAPLSELEHYLEFRMHQLLTKKKYTKQEVTEELQQNK